jgi:hypothetical protein
VDEFIWLSTLENRDTPSSVLSGEMEELADKQGSETCDLVSSLCTSVVFPFGFNQETIVFVFISEFDFTRFFRGFGERPVSLSERRILLFDAVWFIVVCYFNDLLPKAVLRNEFEKSAQQREVHRVDRA